MTLVTALTNACDAEKMRGKVRFYKLLDIVPYIKYFIHYLFMIGKPVCNHETATTEQ